MLPPPDPPRIGGRDYRVLLVVICIIYVKKDSKSVTKVTKKGVKRV